MSSDALLEERVMSRMQAQPDDLLNLDAKATITIVIIVIIVVAWWFILRPQDRALKERAIRQQRSMPIKR